MTEPDPYVEWREQRRLVELPVDFTDQVMNAVASGIRSRASFKAGPITIKSVLALAAGVLLIVFLQVGTVGLGLIALIGVAQ